MRFISDWRESMAITEDLINKSDPFFLSRIGGSDTNAVAAMLELRGSTILENNNPTLLTHLAMVERFNGYYDLTNSFTNYVRYLELLLACYENSQHLFLCNFQLLSMYLRENIHPTFYRETFEGRKGFELLMERINQSNPNCKCLPYTFVEKLVSHPLTLFRAFSRTLVGKRVLVVSPFSESIKANFSNRHSFFKDYNYPEFQVEFCNTPITYAGLPRELYPHEDWFITLQSIKSSIATKQFDIALLACGSYALPIGQYIRDEMAKQAIYVGGVLQLYFGITGRRYRGNQFFDEQINSEFFVSPVEGDRYLQHISVSTNTAKEAFGAYF